MFIYTNHKQITYKTQQISKSTVIVAINNGIYQLSISFLTIVTFYYWFEQCFDHFNKKNGKIINAKNIKTTRLIVNFLFG